MTNGTEENTGQTETQVQPETQPQIANVQNAEIQEISAGAAESLNALRSLRGESPELEAIGQRVEESTAKPEDSKPEPFRDQTQEAQAAENKTPPETPPAVPAQQTEAAPTEPVVAEGSIDSSSLTIENEIFGDKPVNLKGEQQDIVEPTFKSVDEVTKYMKESYGVESFNDLKSKMTDFQKQTENHAALNEKVDGYEKIFTQLPPELYDAVKNHYDGKDWRTSIGNAPTDFNSTVDQLSKEDLVNRYHKDKFSKEDWEEYNDQEGDENVKRMIDVALDSAKQLYSGDKTRFEETQAGLVKDQGVKQEAFATSISNTVGKLTEHVPGVHESYVKKVDQALRANGIYDLFYDKNGNFKEDAAKTFTFAKHGDDLYKQAITQAEKNIKNETTLDLLDRTPEVSESAAKGGNDSNHIRPEVQQFIKNRTGSLNKKNHY